jgi:hypothetical protein
VQYVVAQAVGRIFENLDFEYYHLSIAKNLRVRFEPLTSSSSCPPPSIDVLVGQTFGNSGNNIHEKPNLADNGEGKKKKKNERNQDENNEFKPNKHTAYKYSNNGKGPLHEAVILAGLPVFLKYQNEKIISIEKIEESSRIIKPPYAEEYPGEPYEFADMQAVLSFVRRAKKESIDSLYQRAKTIVKKYNDHDEDEQILLTADFVASYFQDRFSTTHYDVVIGEWDAAHFPDSPRKASILRAVEQHDSGWDEGDEALVVDEQTGDLFDFEDLPDRLKRDASMRGVERLAQDPYAAALVAQHRLHVYRQYADASEWRPFFDVVREARETQLRAAGLGSLDQLLRRSRFPCLLQQLDDDSRSRWLRLHHAPRWNHLAPHA